MNPIQVLSVIKQGNSASFPNQQAQRAFTNLRRNPRNSMEQINRSAVMADQYIQRQITRKADLQTEEIENLLDFRRNRRGSTEITAPSVDAGVNAASLQSVGKVLPDQAELVATGQGSVQQKQNLQNAGLPGSSLETNTSSASVALNQVAGVRELQRNREIVRAELQQQVDAGNLKVPISEKLNLSSSKVLADEKGQRVLQTVPPSLVERRLSALYEKDSGKLAGSYGLDSIKQTQLKQNLQLYNLTGDKRLLNEVPPTSVRMAGQNISVLPVTDFTYSPNIRSLTSRLLDSKPVKGEGGKLVYGQGKLAELSNRTEKLYELRQKFQELGGQTAKERIASIDVELGKIDNFYKGLQARGLPLSTTGFTGAPFISADSQISLKVPSVGELTGPRTAETLARRKQKAVSKQEDYQANTLEPLRDKRRQMMIKQQDLINQGKKYTPEYRSLMYEMQTLDNYGKKIRATSEGFKRSYNQKPPVQVGATKEGIRFYAETVSPTGSKVGTAKAGTAGEGGQVSMQNLSSELVINPASVQVRQERRVKDTKQKGGGGRNVAEYVGGEMGESEATARAFMTELLNAQTSSTTGTVVNRREPNLLRTQARRPRVRGRESIAGSPQVGEGQTYTSPKGTSQRIVQGGSTETAGMRDYDVVTGGPPQEFQGDKTQAGYVKDIYGLRKDIDPKDDPKVKPSQLVRSTGAQNRKVSKEAKELMKNALEISEAKRRGRIEGKPAFFYSS